MQFDAFAGRAYLGVYAQRRPISISLRFHHSFLFQTIKRDSVSRAALAVCASLHSEVNCTKHPQGTFGQHFFIAIPNKINKQNYSPNASLRISQTIYELFGSKHSANFRCIFGRRNQNFGSRSQRTHRFCRNQLSFRLAFIWKHLRFLR